jgi:hypothetical protein
LRGLGHQQMRVYKCKHIGENQPIGYVLVKHIAPSDPIELCFDCYTRWLETIVRRVNNARI